MGGTLTPAQIKGARAMLNWSLMKLASMARLSVSTVKRAEDAHSSLVSGSTMEAIRDALESAGIEFLPDTGSGPGVRLAKDGRRTARSSFERFLH